MALLWNPESRAQQLAEPEAQTGDLREAPMRRAREAKNVRIRILRKHSPAALQIRGE
jgi:hypothetical protein